VPAHQDTFLIPCGESLVSSVLLRHLVKSAHSISTMGKCREGLTRISDLGFPAFYEQFDGIARIEVIEVA
jgi:hypothetical protein